MPSVPPLTFLIVGTPRSGTTLVQRLACELPGVRTPPETHFLGFFAMDLVRRRRFPLEGAALREELDAFAGMPKSRELGIDTGHVHALLEGRAAGPAEMFAAIVSHLAPDAPVIGEKSPEHLLWWRPLSRAFPSLRFVAVVRDPRAVVASARAVWGTGGEGVELRAERWAADQREVARALRVLGPDRVLVLRYEDVVRDEAAARQMVAAFLQVPEPASAVRSSAVASQIVLSREWWKQRAFEPVTEDRVDAWRRELEPQQASAVAAICQRGMRRFGYEADGRAPFGAARGGVRAHVGRLRFRAGRLRHRTRINRITL